MTLVPYVVTLKYSNKSRQDFNFFFSFSSAVLLTSWNQNYTHSRLYYLCMCIYTNTHTYTPLLHVSNYLCLMPVLCLQTGKLNIFILRRQKVHLLRVFVPRLDNKIVWQNVWIVGKFSKQTSSPKVVFLKVCGLINRARQIHPVLLLWNSLAKRFFQDK